jgi:hypothetical protein
MAGVALVVWCLHRQAFFWPGIVRTLRSRRLLWIFLFLCGVVLVLPKDLSHTLTQWRSELIVTLSGENTFLPSALVLNSPEPSLLPEFKTGSLPVEAL